MRCRLHELPLKFLGSLPVLSKEDKRGVHSFQLNVRGFHVFILAFFILFQQILYVMERLFA